MLRVLGKPVPTQDLGDAIVASGRFQAIRYPSMRDLNGSNIAIYCDLVADPNYISVNDKSNAVAGRIP
jgi:hypothetical protein